MKAVRIHDYGTSDVLSYEDVDMPEPKGNEILVHVRAASASPIDWKMRAGYLRGFMDIPLPTTLGRDFSGDVVSVGDDVSGVAAGDMVFGTVDGLSKGSYAEYITVSPENIAPKPSTISYEMAAAVPHSGLTAWQALVEAGGLEPGKSVLIHGAAGGVGTFAVQIAHALGAQVIGTTSQNMDFVRDLGADEVVDYSSTPFETVAHDIDIVLDTIGGDTQERSWQVIKPGGVMVTLIGFTPTSMETAAERGVRAEMIGQHANASQLRSIGELIDTGKITPVVNSVMHISHIREAQDQMAGGHTRGKIVMRMDGDED